MRSGISLLTKDMLTMFLNLNIFLFSVKLLRKAVKSTIEKHLKKSERYLAKAIQYMQWWNYHLKGYQIVQTFRQIVLKMQLVRRECGFHWLNSYPIRLMNTTTDHDFVKVVCLCVCTWCRFPPNPRTKSIKTREWKKLALNWLEGKQKTIGALKKSRSSLPLK